MFVRSLSLVASLEPHAHIAAALISSRVLRSLFEHALGCTPMGRYILEEVNGFSSARGQAMLSGRLQAQLDALDADRDGTISALDSRFLARVNFGLMRFVRSVNIGYSAHNGTSLQGGSQGNVSGGLVTINVTAVAKGELLSSMHASVNTEDGPCTHLELTIY